MKDYNIIEAHMLECMNDPAHDSEHIYRVLHTALDIASTELDVDYEILTAACLLHDIGRPEQISDSSLCHAEVGSKKAFDFLIGIGWTNERAAHVRDCIYTHRFRKDRPPQSIEAKILFDADKIDVSGAIGIARTLMYKSTVGEPLYSLNNYGSINDGRNENGSSFFKEYNCKLKTIHSTLFTDRGREIALGRQKAADDFFNALLEEIKESKAMGQEQLDRIKQQN